MGTKLNQIHLPWHPCCQKCVYHLAMALVLFLYPEFLIYIMQGNRILM